MKKLLILFVMPLLFSCMTYNRINRNCDKFAQVCITEKEVVTVYRDTTIYRIDTVEIQLPPDTVKISELVQVVNNEANFPEIHKEIGLIGVDAGVKRSIMNIDAYFLDSTILVPVHDTIYLEKVIREKSEKELVPVKFIPGFYKFTFWIFWIMSAALLLVIIIALRRYFG